MSKKIKTSRWWYNFKDSLKFYLRLRDPDRGDVVDDQIKADTRINKTLGMPLPMSGVKRTLLERCKR